MLRIINTNYKTGQGKTSTRGRRWKDKVLAELQPPVCLVEKVKLEQGFCVDRGV